MKKLIFLSLLSFGLHAELVSWEPKEVYQSGHIVEHQGEYWLANNWTQDIPPPYKDTWFKLQSPTSNTIQQWQKGVDYKRGNFIEFEGRSYVARQFSHNTPPNDTDQWGPWVPVNLDDFSKITINFEGGEVVDVGAIRVEGRISTIPKNSTLKLNDRRTIRIKPDGTFGFTNSLYNGINHLSLVLIHDGRTYTKKFSVTYNDPRYIAGATFNEQGGSFSVDSGKWKGVSFQVPQHAIGKFKNYYFISGEPQPCGGGDAHRHIMDKVPAGDELIYPPLTIEPVGVQFKKPATLSFPILEGEQYSVYADTDYGYAPIKHTIEGDRLKVELQYTDFEGIFVTKPLPVASDTVLIRSGVKTGAKIYLDGGYIGDTPLELTNLEPKEYQVRIYSVGHNEIFSQITVDSSGQLFNFEPTLQSSDKGPAFELSPDLQDGMTVDDNIFKVRGRLISQNGTPKLIASINEAKLNGHEYQIRVEENGEFEAVFSLFSGENHIYFRATDPAGFTSESSYYTITNAEGLTGAREGRSNGNPLSNIVSALKAQLTWTTNDTDVDMHIYISEGNHAWYSSLSGIPDAKLDHDDTNGFGPETFSMDFPVPSSYTFKAHYYSDHGNGPTSATMKIWRGDKLLHNSTKMLTDGEWWDIYTVEVGDFTIEKISCDNCEPANGDFTTENTIRVQLSDITDVDIGTLSLSVFETSTGYRVPESNITFDKPTKSFVVKLDRRPLESHITPFRSKALSYKIAAQYKTGETTVSTASETITQDIKSRARQEYIDKRRIRPDFKRRTPERSDFITAKQFARQAGENFSFWEFARYSDFGEEIVIVKRSREIANTLRDKWGYPLRATSGWRNPRRNDRLFGKSSINSFHQTGNAIDFNPMRKDPDNEYWPPEAETYVQAQDALTDLAGEVFDLDLYDCLFHAGHLHIEYDPAGSSRQYCPTHR